MANQDGLRVPLTNSALRPEAWKKLLGGYFDRDNLVNAFTYGWDLSLDRNPMPKNSKFNHPSARHFPADIGEYIGKELAFGCLVGPIPAVTPFPVFCSPLATVPKPGSSTRRTITDCSQGKLGINSWIPAHWHRGKKWKIKLPSTDDIVVAIRQVRSAHPGDAVVLFKLDLSRYYRWFLVDPGQVPYLAVRWDDKVYLDLAFSFGNRGAMLGAQRTSNAIAWMFRTQLPPGPGLKNSGRNCSCSDDCSCGDNRLLPYVDDLIAVVPKSRAMYLFNMLLAVLSHLGLQPSTTPGHVVPPSETVVALGVLFDLSNNTISVPDGKLKEIRDLLQFWLYKHNASRRELQQLLGKLLHVSRVVRPGRLHLSRMLDTLRRSKELDMVVPIDSNFHLDIVWWVDNLQHWNGVSILEFTAVHNKIAVDASSNGWLDGSPGLGGFNFIKGEYFKCGVPREMQSWHIADLELLAHLVCARLWAYSWEGLEIWGLTDSEPTELFLRHGRSRKDRRIQMSRLFTAMQHRSKFLWVSGAVRSKANILPDCCSRWREPERRAAFWNECARLGISPRECSVTYSMFNIFYI